MIRKKYVYIFIIFFKFYILESKKLKVSMISADKCDAPAEKNTVTYEISTSNINKRTKVARTNFTVLKPLGPLTMSLKINHLKQNSNKDEIFKLDKVDCHNPVTYQLIRVVNLKLTNDCMVVPGNYLTEKINPQDFVWILTKAMIHPGKYEYVLEYYTDKGLAVCNTIVCLIQEIK